ncbi:MAG: PIN domain-containing protein [Bifidobacteriaceae bacterium]|jgi:predicted nucleic acid-binding protein|nr:PIN domain-containing protein [Bifidobacteriaceae bacterium]
MAAYYVDSSVVGHAILPDGDRRAAAWLDARCHADDLVVASRLLRLELVRLARREQLDLADVDAATDRIALLSIDDTTLRLAETIERHVRSLDAIHLATALRFDPNLTIATHDNHMSSVAQALGFPTDDPLA